MSIGLKCGTVELQIHDPQWDINAIETIKKLSNILGDVAIDIQHIGSTAIPHIKAKPIIDIAVAVRDFESVMPFIKHIESVGFEYRPEDDDDWKLYFVRRGVNGTTTTHHIHVVCVDNVHWKDFILFRDFLNHNYSVAEGYEAIKISLMDKYKNDRIQYTNGKHNFVAQTLKAAQVWDDFGRIFSKIESINKGWSRDKKYYIETAHSEKQLLRIADISEHDRKKNEFEMMKRVAATGIPMSQPIDFGTCNSGKSVYQLLSWVDGQDAEEYLPLLPETEQYVLGLEAGRILRKMQTLEAVPASADWLNGYGTKIDSYIDKYQHCGMTFDGDEVIIQFIESNRHLMDNRPMCFTHDDFHVGNMIISPENKLSIIDFQRFRMVEPTHAMSGLVFSAKTSPHFATGQIHGYFEGDVPEDFWKLLALYMAAIAVNALAWSIPYGQDEIDFAYQQIANILSWYDNMQEVVPSWYLEDFYIQNIDGIPYKLKAPFNFSFISKYGKVFKVFDDQDSGNICFGTERDGNRYFIKFAGAPTDRACVSAEEAIANLKRTVPIYRDLAHPTLIKYIDSEEIAGGFAMVFEWINGECPHPMYPLSRRSFLEMSFETKVNVFEDILDFHAHVAAHGYVAIDFYDGSIMYDFENEKTVICDIDFYSKAPYINQMGRMWGSSRFMSPEEFKMGATIDEVTNVYTMGATVLCLFAGGDRTPSAWPLGEAQYAVVKKATSDNRSERQQSIQQLLEEWEAAKDVQ